jgi:hypothetical protein
MAQNSVEAGGIAAHRLRQRMAFEHFAAHPAINVFSWLFALLGDGIERFFQRDGGGDQRGQLAGEQG